MALDRRDFIKYSSLASASLLMPEFLKAAGEQFSLNDKKGKILIVIQLAGGNDGLNTVVPVRNDIYYRERPGLSLKKEETILLNDECGLHPSLTSLADLFNSGELSVLNSVGYPNPNRSHFRSTDIWHSASSAEKVISTGWLGRYLDAFCAGSSPHAAVEIDDTLSMILKGESSNGFAFRDPNVLKLSQTNPVIRKVAEKYEEQHDHPQVEYLHKVLTETVHSADYLYEHSKIYRSSSAYPFHEFGRRMKTIGELICSGSDTMIYYASLPGFDTHALQKGQQARVLKVYAEAIQALVKDLKNADRFKDTLILTFSEFGRRVKQNASKGTDHGAAGNVFVLGGKLQKPGLYNDLPDLSKLNDGDIIHSIDFRSIYASILSSFLQVDASKVVEGDFDKLNFI